MTAQTHWTLLESFPASVQSDEQNFAQPHQMIAGTLHLEQPLSPAENAIDPHLKLAIDLPGEDDVWLAQKGVQQLHEITTMAADSQKNLQCPLFTTTPDGKHQEFTAIISQLPRNTTDTERFVISVQRKDNPAIVVSLSATQFTTFIGALEKLSQ